MCQVGIRVFRQTDNYSCGARSLQIVFSHYDFYPLYSEIKALCETSIDVGTELSSITKAARMYGFKAVPHTLTATVDRLKYYTDKSRVAVLCWFVGVHNGRECCHASVAYKVDKKYVYLIDPSSHTYTEPITLIRCTNLERCWAKHEGARWFVAIYP